ncbi:MAG: hypothetical protein MUF49_18865 [Oculatellaceae cyanobacterium Prado106]|nr:hypothetical protein [Oculatellaceae cyanobacterium Prado106]
MPSRPAPPPISPPPHLRHSLPLPATPHRPNPSTTPLRQPSLLLAHAPSTPAVLPAQTQPLSSLAIATGCALDCSLGS